MAIRYSAHFLCLLLVAPCFSINSFGQAPKISGINPTTGAAGISVNVTGTNFSATPANNTVYFGGAKATVTAATATQLTVTAPAGATYKPITVTVAGLTGHSDVPFSINFQGPGLIEASSFATKTDFASGTGPNTIVVADLDGDGKSDLTAVNQSSNSISVYRNISTIGSITAGSFAAKVDFTTGSTPKGLAIGDLDGDGKPDLAVTNRNSNTVSVFRNTSVVGAITAGSLAPKVDFTTGTGPRAVAIRDIDGDGKPELAVGNATSATLSLFQNTATAGTINAGSFAAKVDYATDVPYEVSLYDLDGDKKPELISSNESASTVSVFFNASTPGTISNSTFASRVNFDTGGGR